MTTCDQGKYLYFEARLPVKRSWIYFFVLFTIVCVIQPAQYDIWSFIRHKGASDRHFVRIVKAVSYQV